MPVRAGKYIHFKGNEYEVIGEARHSETQEKLIVYRALYGDHGLWVRPESMWNEIVEHNGKRVKRFTHIDDVVPESAPELSPVSKPDLNEEAGIHKHSSPSEKIELFRSLFAGRGDVFAKRFENNKKGISGYVPVCDDE